MNCPTCGERPEVLKVKQSSPGVTDRLLRCAAHGTFWSQEVLKRWIEPSRSGLPADQPEVYPYTTEVRRRTEIERVGVPPSTRNHGPSLTVKSGGGVGGGLSSGSDLGLVLIRSDGDQIPRSKRSKATPKPNPVGESQEFRAFYLAYPRKEKRPAARKAWMKGDCDPIADRIMAGLGRWQSEYASRDPDKIPHPATWLNNEQWNDMPPRRGSGTASSDLDEMVRNLASGTP